MVVVAYSGLGAQPACSSSQSGFARQAQRGEEKGVGRLSIMKILLLFLGAITQSESFSPFEEESWATTKSRLTKEELTTC